METVIVAILIVFGLIALSVIGFAIWLLLMIIRGVGRLVSGGGKKPQLPTMPHLVRCTHETCRAENPKSARFCRRCGKLIHLHPHAARNAALV